MPRSGIFLFCALIATTTSAQVGTWKSHTDMKNVRSLVTTGEYTWAATSGGVYRYSATSSEFRRYTNIDGLATINTTAIVTDRAGRVFAGSSTGHLNILNPGEESWVVIPDIARATSRPQRGINKFFAQEDRIYVATDFGVIVYFPDQNEFGDTYVKFGGLPSPVKVNDVSIDGRDIWVATDKGIAMASLDSPNLQEPSSWTVFTAGNGFQIGNTLSIGFLGTTPVAGVSTGAIYFDGNAWQSLNLPQSETVNGSVHVGTDFFLSTEKTLYRVRSIPAGVETFLLSADFVTTASFSFTALADAGDGGRIVIGSTLGMALVDIQAPGNNHIFIKPNGPNSNQFIGLMIDEQGILWSASGRDAAGQGIYSLENGVWQNYTADAYPVMQFDSYVRANKGNNGTRWFNGWGMGLLLLRANGEFTRYSAENVPGFPGVGTSPNFNVTYGTTVDSRGNTWSVHYRPTDGKVLSAFTRDSAWIFYKNVARPTAGEYSGISIDFYGTKWMILDDARGIATFNENGTLSDLSDDSWDFIGATDPSGLNAGVVTAIATDLTGDIWVGTDIGLRTIFNPLTPEKITQTCHNTRCNIEGQYINCIAVDALNNKWIGTRAGVYLLSPDGSTIVAQYNTTNSPLLDDDVKSISVHPRTGVAYFGTDRGLSSLETTSIQPDSETDELRVVPNPYRPESDGTAMIDGLVEGASVKIFTMDGTVIAEIQTPGGRIGFWDGRTSDGKFAPSGIYFLAAYSFDGSKVVLGKIAVIR